MIYGDFETYSEVPELLRGIAPDPLALGQSNNLYGYTMNNPVNNVDLNGDFIISAIVAVATVVVKVCKVVLPVVSAVVTVCNAVVPVVIACMKLYYTAMKIYGIVKAAAITAGAGAAVNTGFQIYDNIQNDRPWHDIDGREVGSSALTAGFAGGLVGAGVPIWAIILGNALIGAGGNILEQNRNDGSFDWEDFRRSTISSALWGWMGGNKFDMERLLKEFWTAFRDQFEEFARRVFDFFFSGDDDICPFNEDASPQLPPHELMPYLPRVV